ncbi:MAG: hypothetical protein RL534_806 [Actinomycetota bacterium]
MAELAIEAGLPEGVFNVVPGLGAEAGQALAKHMDVAKIAFTGSGPTGWMWQRLLLPVAVQPVAKCSNMQRNQI